MSRGKRLVPITSSIVVVKIDVPTQRDDPLPVLVNQSLPLRLRWDIAPFARAI